MCLYMWQVLDEIGISMGEALVDVPGKKKQEEKKTVNDDDKVYYSMARAWEELCVENIWQT
jgi:hypothetical protein